MSELIIRQISYDELIHVHDLAHEIWPVTFGSILSKDQIEYMLNWMYSLDSLNSQMETGCKFLIASQDNLRLAYASFQLDYKPGICRLHKLYVSPDMHRQGLGTKMIRTIVDSCVDHDNSKIELNVNRFNEAVGFYKKLGFIITGEEDIDIGHNYLMEDYIMELEI